MYILEDINNLVYEVQVNPPKPPLTKFNRPANQKLPTGGKTKGFIKGIGKTGKDVAKRVGKMGLIGGGALGIAALTGGTGNAAASGLTAAGKAISAGVGKAWASGSLSGAATALKGAGTGAASAIKGVGVAVGKDSSANFVKKFAHGSAGRFLDPSLSLATGKSIDITTTAGKIAHALGGSWTNRLRMAGGVAGATNLLKSKSGQAMKERFMTNTKVGRGIRKEVNTMKSNLGMNKPKPTPTQNAQMTASQRAALKKPQ